MPREGKAPAFQFYAADWLADEDVRCMSLAERGAYIDLLAFAWREGSAPDDLAKCARLLGCSSREFAPIWPTVRARFVAQEGRLVSPRMEQQRAELDTFIESAGNGGRVVAARMTPEQRTERARKAAKTRYAAACEQAGEQAASKHDTASSLLAAANTASASASASSAPTEQGEPPASPDHAFALSHPTATGDSPLPFRARDAIAAVEKHSAGRFRAPKKLSQGHAIAVERVIRLYPRIAQWDEFGKWLAVGGGDARKVMDIGALSAKCDEWFPFVEAWCKAGRGPVAVSQAGQARNGAPTTPSGPPPPPRHVPKPRTWTAPPPDPLRAA